MKNTLGPKMLKKKFEMVKTSYHPIKLDIDE